MHYSNMNKKKMLVEFSYFLLLPFFLSLCGSSAKPITSQITMEQHGAGGLNLLTADVKSLQALLSNGTYTSVDLVEKYVAQINKYNPYLRAVLQVTPDELLKVAAQSLDDERKGGKTRGPLHGIPILIKVHRSEPWWMQMLTACFSVG
jgi:hypothetical protein